MLWPTFHRLVASRTQEPRDGESLSQVLLVVPAIEVRLFVCRDISPDHQESCALFLRHLTLLHLSCGGITIVVEPAGQSVPATAQVRQSGLTPATRLVASLTRPIRPRTRNQPTQ